MNLIGRCEMDSNFDNPFFKADEIIKKTDCDLWFVDFHAEATSEKGALGWYLDGKGGWLARCERLSEAERGMRRSELGRRITVLELAVAPVAMN